MSQTFLINLGLTETGEFMKAYTFILLVLLLTCQTNFAEVLETKTEKDIKLKISLKDGSIFIGKPIKKTVPFKAQFGLLNIDLIHTSKLTLSKDQKVVTALFRNGDKISGQLQLQSLELETLVGKLSILLEHIRGIDVALHFKGAQITDYLIKGLTPDGLPTEFIKDLPPEIAERYKRVTRTVNTMGSIVGRHDSAPWLYPVRGKYEAPKRIKDGNNTLYPIWGSWKQDRASGWVWYDENAKRFKGSTNLRIPHKSSSIDFYVVPDNI